MLFHPPFGPSRAERRATEFSSVEGEAGASVRALLLRSVSPVGGNVAPPRADREHQKTRQETPFSMDKVYVIRNAIVSV